MDGYRIDIKSRMEGNVAVGEVSLRRGEIVTKGAVECDGNISPADAQKVAKLMAVEKLLALANSRSARLVIPFPVTKVLQMAHALVKVRSAALLGDKDAKKKLREYLADSSPVMRLAIQALKVL